MERRYLVAALAIIATFAGFSHGFRKLQQMSSDTSGHFETMAMARCWTASTAQKVARVRAHLQRSYSPEQAQLLAEMNVPLANMQATISEQMARQDAAIERCVRERALQAAERAQRDEMRAQRDAMHSMSHVYAYAYAGPESIAVNLPSDFEQQMQKKAFAATQLALNNARLQIAAVKLTNIEIPAIDVDVNSQPSPNPVPNVHCKVGTSVKKQHASRVTPIF